MSEPVPAGVRRFFQHRKDEEEAEVIPSRTLINPTTRRMGRTVHKALRCRRTGEVLRSVCGTVAMHKVLVAAVGERVTCKRCLKK